MLRKDDEPPVITQAPPVDGQGPPLEVKWRGPIRPPITLVPPVDGQGPPYEVRWHAQPDITPTPKRPNR